MNRPFLFPRFFSLWLILSLALPNPAFALRQFNAGAEESPVRDQLSAVFGHPTPVSNQQLFLSAAGAEEKPIELRGHEGSVGGISYSRNKRHSTILTAGIIDGTVRLWSQDSGTPVFKPIPFDPKDPNAHKKLPPVLAAIHRAEHRGILVVTPEGATTYESSRGVPVDPKMVFSSPFKLSVDKFYPSQVALSPGRTSMLVIEDGASEAVIQNLDPERKGADGHPIQIMSHLKPNQGHPTSVAYRAISSSHGKDGGYLAIGTNEGTVEIWTAYGVGRGKKASRMEAVLEHASGATILSLAFAPREKILASADNRGEIRLWFSKGPRFISMRHSKLEKIYALAFSPDGKTLASAGESGEIYLWDIAPGNHRTLVDRTMKEGTPVYSLAFRPNGKEIAAGYADGIGRIWKVQAAGAEEITWPGQILPQGIFMLADLISTTVLHAQQGNVAVTPSLFLKVLKKFGEYPQAARDMFTHRGLSLDQLRYFLNEFPRILGVPENDPSFVMRIILTAALMQGIYERLKSRKFPIQGTREEQISVLLADLSLNSRREVRVVTSSADDQIPMQEQRDITSRLLDVLLKPPAAGAEEALGKLQEKLADPNIKGTLPLLIDPEREVDLETFLPGLGIGELLRKAGYRGTAAMVPLSFLREAPPQAEPIAVFVEEVEGAVDARESLAEADRMGLIQFTNREKATVIVGGAKTSFTQRQILLQVNGETGRYVSAALLRYLLDNPEKYPPGTVVLINRMIESDFGNALLLFA